MLFKLLPLIAVYVAIQHVQIISTARVFTEDVGGPCKFGGDSGIRTLLFNCVELEQKVKSRGGIGSSGTIQFLKSRTQGFLNKSPIVCCFDPIEKTTEKTTAKPPPVENNPDLPTLGECGYSSVTKISGGTDFVHGAVPWLVGLGRPRRGRPFNVRCGASLITRKHILTAAHCFRTASISHALLGEHSLSEPEDYSKPLMIAIKNHADPGYDSKRYYHDISVAVLQEEIQQFTDYIRPVCLPLTTKLEDFNFAEKKATVTGWGDTFHRQHKGTDKPLFADLFFVEKAKCREIYNFAPEVPLDETQICFGDVGERDACQGDSGGPMTAMDWKRQRTTLVGVVAFGVGCGNETYPGVYSYVPQYMPWILKQIRTL